MHLIRSDVSTIRRRTTPHAIATPLVPEAPPLTRIRARGYLRIGYFPDSLPFAFTNEFGEVVGFDVEMGYRLAHDLGVGVRLVRATDRPLPEQLADGLFDILMSGFPLTTQAAEEVPFSRPYLQEHLAFVVEYHRRREFAALDAVRRMPHLRLAVPDLAYDTATIRALVPNAQIVQISPGDGVKAFFASGPGDVDALVLTAERGSAWSLLYPRFSVAVPHPHVLTVPLAYATSQASQGHADLVRFLDRWLELKKRDGTVAELYDDWVLGKNATPVRPRWSVIRNVLHWIG